MSLGFNEGEKNFSVNLRHKKCDLVHKVRQQISNAEKKFTNKAEYNTSNSSICSCRGSSVLGCWSQITCCTFVILSVLALAWACILYGTIIGAALCTNINNMQFLPWFKIPGLQWQNRYDEKLWKVF